MKRKKLFKVLTAVGTACILTSLLMVGCAKEAEEPGVTPAPEAEVITWKWQIPQVPAVPYYWLFEQFADNIKEVSQGEFVIDTYEVGALVPTPELFDACADNTIQQFNIWTNQWTGKNTAFAVISYWPFGMSAWEMQTWYKYAGGIDLARQIFNRYGLQWWPASHIEPEEGPFSKRPFLTLADMKGKSFRMGAGPGGDILKKVDVDVVVIMPEECFSSLDRGVVDMLEWGGPASDYGMKLHEAGKYLQQPGWFQVTCCNDITTNLEAWNALPPHLQTLFDIAVWEFGSWYPNWVSGAGMDMHELMLQEGMVVNRLSDADLKVIEEASYDVAEEWADANPDFKVIWESQQEFKKKFGAYWKFLETPSQVIR